MTERSTLKTTHFLVIRGHTSKQKRDQVSMKARCELIHYQLFVSASVLRWQSRVGASLLDVWQTVIVFDLYNMALCTWCECEDVYTHTYMLACVCTRLELSLNTWYSGIWKLMIGKWCPPNARLIAVAGSRLHISFAISQYHCHNAGCMRSSGGYWCECLVIVSYVYIRQICRCWSTKTITSL